MRQPGQVGYTGTVDGTNRDARFNRPGGLAVDGGGSIYVADSWNNAIRKIILSGTNWVVSTIGGLCGESHPSPSGLPHDCSPLTGFSLPLRGSRWSLPKAGWHEKDL